MPNPTVKSPASIRLRSFRLNRRAIAQVKPLCAQRVSVGAIFRDRHHSHGGLGYARRLAQNDQDFPALWGIPGEHRRWRLRVPGSRDAIVRLTLIARLPCHADGQIDRRPGSTTKPCASISGCLRRGFLGNFYNFPSRIPTLRSAASPDSGASPGRQKLHVECALICPGAGIVGVASAPPASVSAHKKTNVLFLI